jgi:hypothetical protein
MKDFLNDLDNELKNINISEDDVVESGIVSNIDLVTNIDEESEEMNEVEDVDQIVDTKYSRPNGEFV